MRAKIAGMRGVDFAPGPVVQFLFFLRLDLGLGEDSALPPSVRRPRRARPARRRRTPPPRQEAPRARPPGRLRSACESGWARLPGRTCDPPRQATPDEPEPCRARATCPWRSPKRAPGAGILRRAAGRAHLPCPANDKDNRAASPPAPCYGRNAGCPAPPVVTVGMRIAAHPPRRSGRGR